jgi:hypothetical protein
MIDVQQFLIRGDDLGVLQELIEMVDILGVTGLIVLQDVLDTKSIE